VFRPFRDSGEGGEKVIRGGGRDGDTRAAVISGNTGARIIKKTPSQLQRAWYLS